MVNPQISMQLLISIIVDHEINSPNSTRHRCSLRGIGDDRERQADPPHIRRNTSVIQLDDWVSDDVPNDLRVRYQTQ